MHRICIRWKINVLLLRVQKCFCRINRVASLQGTSRTSRRHSKSTYVDFWTAQKSLCSNLPLYHSTAAGNHQKNLATVDFISFLYIQHKINVELSLSMFELRSASPSPGRSPKCDLINSSFLSVVVILKAYHSLLGKCVFHLCFKE